jgi:large subunit ribosomal protein L19e
MNLDKKKSLAIRTLGVGKNRIIFNMERLDEIKEAITRQDIRDLLKDKAISVKEIKGRKKIVKRKTRRRAGSIKKKVKTRKRDYMTITRKLRAFLLELKKKKIINQDEFIKLRKEIRSRDFRSKAHIKERINQILKERK